MSWIKEIPYEEARGILKKYYDRLKGPGNYLDNILTVHSLRLHTLDGHMSLYRKVLHNASNTLPLWFLEAIGVLTSILNGCNYCIRHHYNGMKKQLGNDKKSEEIKSALETGKYGDAFPEDQVQVMNYVEKLVKTPWKVTEADIINMKKFGYGDGEVLEVNQVVGYFCYANRTVLGLGVNNEGEVFE